MTNAGVGVDCCTPRTGSLLTHHKFAKLGLWSPVAEIVTGVVLTNGHPRAAGAVNWCRLDLACTDRAASAANLIVESKQCARPMPLLLQTGGGSLGRNATSTP